MKIGSFTLSLWNIIRDFYVVYVFGGTKSTGGTYTGSVGKVYASSGGNSWILDLNGIPALSQDFLDDRGLPVSGYYPLSEWLSTTCTIITLVIILICIAFFIRWIFKVCSNAILLR